MKIFLTSCSDFIYDKKFLTKLFHQSLKDIGLGWFFFFPNYSIVSFQQLVDVLLQYFQDDIGPQFTSTNYYLSKKVLIKNVLILFVDNNICIHKLLMLFLMLMFK